MRTKQSSNDDNDDDEWLYTCVLVVVPTAAAVAATAKGMPVKFSQHTISFGATVSVSGLRIE